MVLVVLTDIWWLQPSLSGGGEGGEGGEVQWKSLGGLTVNFTTKNAVHTIPKPLQYQKWGNGGLDTFEKCLFKIEHLGIMIVPPSLLPRLANTQTALFASSIIPIPATLPPQTI